MSDHKWMTDEHGLGICDYPDCELVWDPNGKRFLHTMQMVIGAGSGHTQNSDTPSDGAQPKPTASPDSPIYAKVPESDQPATRLFMITCDEGWRTSIVADGMYEWTADWLLGILGRQPFAPGGRPD